MAIAISWLLLAHAMVLDPSAQPCTRLDPDVLAAKVDTTLNGGVGSRVDAVEEVNHYRSLVCREDWRRAPRRAVRTLSRLLRVPAARNSAGQLLFELGPLAFDVAAMRSKEGQAGGDRSQPLPISVGSLISPEAASEP